MLREVTVADPVESAEDVAAIVGRADGRIGSRSEMPGTDTHRARATLVVRIPAADFDDVLSELRGLGEVDSVQLEASDVTQQRQDASGLLVVAGVLLPWLGAALVLGGIATAIVALALRARRHGHERAAGPGTPREDAPARPAAGPGPGDGA